MKKILIITPYKDLVGGVEVVTKTLADTLRESGMQVNFLTADNLCPQSFIEKIMVKIFGLPYLTSKAFKKLDSSIYDHIICNGEYGLGVKHKSVFAYFHGSYLGLKKYNTSQLKLKNHIMLMWRSYLQCLASRGKRVIAVSYFLKEILKEQGIHTDIVIGNPIDLKRFRPRENKILGEYLFIGRYDYWAKGIDIIETLNKRNYSVACYVNSNEINPKIDLKTEVPNRELPDIYNQYKVLIFPSRFESFGMVPAEAMASGLPLLMHPVGIGFKLQESLSDFVIENFLDEAELSKKIDNIKNNYKKYSDLSRKYAEENFSLDVFKEQWLKILNA